MSLLYAPINTLKPVTDNVWIVDGPEIAFGPPLLNVPFSTRMTIVRLAGNSLLIHSPTTLDTALKAEIDAIGTVKWIIGPNRIHYWWVPDWHATYPEAQVFLAPRIKEQGKGRIDFDGQPLNTTSGYPWDAEIATLPIAGSFMTEIEFFHRPSRTLILTDFIENFEAGKMPSFWLRWLVRIAGVANPNGSMPLDMRATYRRQRNELRAAIETMIAWDPARIILAHGKWFEHDGRKELERAFRWVLK